MSLKAVPTYPEQNGRKVPDSLTALERIDCIESSLLNLLQEIRYVKADFQKQVNKGAGLERLLEAEQVAEILGVDIGYVYQQARAAKIPSVKLGKYRKFSPSQIKKWLDRKNNS